MATLRRRLRYVLGAVAACSVALVGCEQYETVDEEFATFEHARTAGAVGANALIPEFFAATARRIHFYANIDTNERWITFEVPPNDMTWFESSCGASIDLAALNVRAAPTEDWPSWLDSEKSLRSVPAPWRIGRCADGGAVAVNLGDGSAAYWRSPQ